jgi:tetratricopeptide (TPR) repeat protein
MGQARQAITCHWQALDIAIETGDRQGEGQVLPNLGEAYQMLQRPERSRESYLRALHVYRQADDRQGEAETRRKLGDLLHDNGSTPQALEHWRRALAIFEELGDPRAGDVRRQLSHDAGMAGSHSAAERAGHGPFS